MSYVLFQAFVVSSSVNCFQIVSVTYFAALSNASILLHTYLAVAAPVADVAAVAERPRVHRQADSARLARIPQTVVHVRLSYVLKKTPSAQKSFQEI